MLPQNKNGELFSLRISDEHPLSFEESATRAFIIANEAMVMDACETFESIYPAELIHQVKIRSLMPILKFYTPRLHIISIFATLFNIFSSSASILILATDEHGETRINTEEFNKSKIKQKSK